MYANLHAIEKEIELSKERGAGILDEDIEEHRRHLELIIDLCKDIRSSSQYDVRRVFERVGGQLNE